jgi:hypothetical protein
MTIAALTDEQLFNRAVKAIWNAAAGESRGGDRATYDAAMDLLEESNRRLAASGHEKYCESGIYSRAYEQATAEHAYREPQPKSCTCGAGR